MLGSVAPRLRAGRLGRAHCTASLVAWWRCIGVAARFGVIVRGLEALAPGQDAGSEGFQPSKNNVPRSVTAADRPSCLRPNLEHASQHASANDVEWHSSGRGHPQTEGPALELGGSGAWIARHQLVAWWRCVGVAARFGVIVRGRGPKGPTDALAPGQDPGSEGFQPSKNNVPRSVTAADWQRCPRPNLEHASQHASSQRC